MALKYETAIATFIQFVALSILNVGTGVISVVTQCRQGGDSCVSNIIVSLIFFMLIAIWFACIWVLGYAAQERRNKRLAQALIIVEIGVAVVALFNAKHHTDPLSLITSITDLGLSVWVIYLAIRLIKAGGGRIVSRQRPRHRRPGLGSPGSSLPTDQL